MISEPCQYLMDDAREATRLAEKVDAAEWVRRYLLPLAAESKRILDVGCGPGVIAAELGHRLPEAEVIGVDLSPARLDEARHKTVDTPNVSFQVGAASRLPFAEASFDVVYSRFLLEYLPDRREAIAEMVRVCRPGGRLFLQDLDGQLVWHDPVDAELQTGIETVLAAWTNNGFDAFVGRKLFGLARTAGLRDISVTAESYHLYAGPIDERNCRLWELKFDIALPAAAQALGSRYAAERLKRRFLDYLRADSTLTYSVVFTVVASKP